MGKRKKSSHFVCFAQCPVPLVVLLCFAAKEPGSRALEEQSKSLQMSASD